MSRIHVNLSRAVEQDDLRWIDGRDGRVNYRAGISVEPGRRLVSSSKSTWLNGFRDRLIRPDFHSAVGAVARMDAFRGNADFFPSCETHEGLHAVLNSAFGHYSVKTPGPLAMARMISGPVDEVALAAPVALDPLLKERMVNDAVSASGGLALLAFALKDLYDQCRASGRMDLAAYDDPRFDGLVGVIQRRADRALERAGADTSAALPRVFSHLLTVQSDGTATRRREDQRRWSNDLAAQGLIAEFTRQDTRLLVVGPDDHPTIEVAHEAQLREWPTLVRWIEDRGEALQLRDKLTEETRLWVRDGRPDSRRWRHELLDRARRLLAEADLLGDLEREGDLERKSDISDFLSKWARSGWRPTR